jgi:diketogulonate reductase-like aldo/keto reductase
MHMHWARAGLARLKPAPSTTSPHSRAYSMKFEGLANEKLGAPDKPPFIYGTAWKKDNTVKLVKEAIAAGFRAVDTAAQPRHYREDLVGIALRDVFGSGLATREQIFV